MPDDYLFRNENEEIESIEFGSDKKVEETDEYELIPEGDYEVVISKLEKKVSSKGNDYLNITFSIREDVKQNYGNRKLWYTIFKRPNDRAYNFNKINEIIVTQEGRKDYKRHFRETDEILQYLIGLHLRLTVGVEFNQFKGKDDNVIVDGSFSPSIADQELEGTSTPVPDLITESDLF